MRSLWPWLALTGALFIGATFVAAWASDGDEPRSGGIAINVGDPSDGGTAATATPVASTAVLADLSGFIMPIDGACLPDLDSVMPNAPREYRNGVHEGVDLYPGLACAEIERGTEVLAMYDGVVVRVDERYRELTREEADITESTPATLDRFRGRQVWVDHGTLRGTDERIVARYAHLEGVAADIDVGDAVRAGQVVGYVGNSGTPESLDDEDAEIHLHFEVRVGDGFLGEDQPADVVRESYRKLFS